MTDILNYISTWSVLKWVVLVLIAGFIGQFGRMMAESMMNKVRLRRAKNHPGPTGQGETEGPQVSSTGVVQVNLPSGAVEEQRILPAGVPLQDSVPRTAPSLIQPDKKALKAMAKARKKEAKAEGKK
jgi:hypothetical protein